MTHHAMTPQMLANTRKLPNRAKKTPAASNAELPLIGDVLKSMKDILREDGLLPNPNWH
ncbi:MAG: hypothetical protein ACKO1J_13865 [Tagaea sp.]